MDQVSLQTLTGALQKTTERLRPQLPDDSVAQLAILLDQMQCRYPHQDLADSMEGYLQDYEQLALKTSLEAVEEALEEWRITPGAKFFPRPDEIAAAIGSRESRRIREAEASSRAERRQAQVDEFWRLLPEWIAITGQSEEEILARWPSYKGTKPRDRDGAKKT
jgi:hypothetical protein